MSRSKSRPIRPGPALHGGGALPVRFKKTSPNLRAGRFEVGDPDQIQGPGPLPLSVVLKGLFPRSASVQ